MADVSDEIAHLEQLAVTLRRRRRVLETQRGRFAERDVPPHLVLELEDTRRELARHEAELRRLRPSPADARPPYLGLATFQEANADLFFGRDLLVADLVERAGRAAFLAVLGASGSGKSSVVRAGLIPMLKGGALPGSDMWRYVIFKPGARPLDTLAAELAKLQGGDLGAALALIRQLAESDRALLLAADMLLDCSAGQRLVLVVDQFEELWTLLPAAPEQRTALMTQQQAPFTQLLLTAVAAPDTPLLVVLTMRADFLHRAAEHPELARAIAEHDVIVSPMTPAELRDAIVRPAELAGGSFESGLVDELIAQTSGREGALPLLEYTLLDLWKQRQGDGTLTWEDYKTVGRVEGVLAARADTILQERFTSEQLNELRQVLLRLVQPGQGTVDTRRRVPLADLAPAGEAVEDVQALLKPLTDERLLTAGWDSASGVETIEVTHEALIRAWPTLNHWISEARDDLRFQIQLEEAAQEWQASGQSADLLWSGLRLSNAEDWIARARPRLNARDLAFLDASRAEEQRRAEEAAAAARDRQRLQEEQRNARRLRRFLIAVGVLLAVAIGAGVVAFRSQQDAQKARDQSRRLAWAGESLFELQHAPERAMLLALAAQPADPAVHLEPMVARALFSAFDEGRIRRTLHGQASPISEVAWSPDGKFVLTGSGDGTARVWDATSGAVVQTLRGHTDGITAVAWSPDGKNIITGSGDGTARVWDASSGQKLQTFRGHTGTVSAVAWSPDGNYLLTGSDDQTVRVWDARSGQELHILRGHTDRVTAVAWSPDGNYLFTGSIDGTARVWDARSGQELHILRGHNGPITAVAWSPDGTFVLTGSWDHTARVWDAASGVEVRTLRGHMDWLFAVAWSPDGNYLLTGSVDKTARVWYAAPRLMIADLTRRVCDIYERDDAKIRTEAPGWNWHGCAAALTAVDADLKELDTLRSVQ